MEICNICCYLCRDYSSGQVRCDICVGLRASRSPFSFRVSAVGVSNGVDIHPNLLQSIEPSHQQALLRPSSRSVNRDGLCPPISAPVDSYPPLSTPKHPLHNPTTQNRTSKSTSNRSSGWSPSLSSLIAKPAFAGSSVPESANPSVPDSRLPTYFRGVLRQFCVSVWV